MWSEKSHEYVIHSDIERELQNKPDVFASNTNLPFKDNIFSTVFFDPPFKWNCDDHPFFSFPNTEALYDYYPDISKRTITSYYGIERYKSRGQLVSYIYQAKKEIRRVLKDDGVLWVRWCTMTNMTHTNLLSIFADGWTEMTRHEISNSKRNTGTTMSFWFMLMKKPLDFLQADLMTVGGKQSGK